MSIWLKLSTRSTIWPRDRGRAHAPMYSQEFRFKFTFVVIKSISAFIHLFTARRICNPPRITSKYIAYTTPSLPASQPASQPARQFLIIAQPSVLILCITNLNRLNDEFRHFVSFNKSTLLGLELCINVAIVYLRRQ